MSQDLLKKLNKEQLEAVTHDKGPLLIVAGAGTGKTTVLINRLAYLLSEKKASAEEILLLTFTEKAAGEMEERAYGLLPYGYVDLWINTFHGFSERLLREHALDIGLGYNFKLLTETEQWILIKKNLDKFNLDYYRPLGNPGKFISELLRHFSRLKDENISPEEYLQYVKECQTGDKKPGLNKIKKGKKEEVEDDESEDDEMEINRLQELAGAYQTYNQLLIDNNYLDFGDLIIYTLKLLKTRPNILRYYHQKFRYIMVDEFQDTNWAQYELVKLLSYPENNLLVVGDDDQAIYKFRGASISNIMQFKDDFPDALELVLTENYRSRQEILDKAYHFIQHNNPNRLETKLKINKQLLAKKDFSANPELGPAVNFFNFSSADEELSFVAWKILEIYESQKDDKEPISWSDFAILVRANDTADAYVKELNRYNIPNQFMSWRGLYYKPLILDILAYFRLLDNYHESTSLFRVLNMDIFKVSHLDLIEINKIAARKVWSLYEALENIENIKNLSPETYKNVNKLLSLINKHSVLAEKEKTTKIFLSFAYDSGLLAGLDPDKDLESYSYLNQFYKKIKNLEEMEADLRLSDFLQSINLELEAGETGALKLDFADMETVKIMTVHGAKGLEFKYVFIVNLVDKKFPTINRGEKIPLPDDLIREQVAISLDAHTEEERRLFYVAATRAKEALFLTGAKDYGGAREKKPSRFISEMNLESVLSPEIKLSQKNEFLRDLHYLNSREISLGIEKTAAEKYPLPNKFSFSQLMAFSTCPLQYKFAFVLKIPASTDKASLIFGRVLHNTLYNFLLPVLSERQKMEGTLFGELEKDSSQKKIKDYLNKERLFQIYDEFWQNDGYPSKENREEYRKRGLDVLEKFWNNYENNPPQEILYLEKKFSFKIGGDIIKGAIDRIDKLPDGSLEIVDYKTGQTKNKLEFSEKRQLILYQLFIEEFLNIKVSTLSYYYLESGKKLSFSASAKDITKLKLEIQSEIAAIKKREFPPKPSLKCKYCDFNSICEFRQH